MSLGLFVAKVATRHHRHHRARVGSHARKMLDDRSAVRTATAVTAICLPREPAPLPPPPPIGRGDSAAMPNPVTDNVTFVGIAPVNVCRPVTRRSCNGPDGLRRISARRPKVNQISGRRGRDAARAACALSLSRARSCTRAFNAKRPAIRCRGFICPMRRSYSIFRPQPDQCDAGVAFTFKRGRGWRRLMNLIPAPWIPPRIQLVVLHVYYVCDVTH